MIFVSCHIARNPLSLPGGCSERLGVQVPLDVADGVHHDSVCDAASLEATECDVFRVKVTLWLRE